MEMTIKNRSELNEKDCWDLTALYASAEDWEKDFAKLESTEYASGVKAV